MKTRLLVFAAVVILCGCAHRVPTWSKANAEARASGEFTIDDAYLESQQFTNDIMEDVETVMRLKKQLGHDQGEAARMKLNASMSSLQKATATNSAQQQQAWLAQSYAASPNMVGKITTMTDPINAKGQIMVEQIISYYDNSTNGNGTINYGPMRYATNRFNKLK